MPRGWAIARTDRLAVSDVVAIGVGIVLPTVAVLFYFGIAVHLVVPFRDVARLVRRA